MDNKTYAIGVLSITAVILLVAVLIISSSTPAARAGEISSVAGDFTISVGHATNDSELLYIVDNTTERMCVYGVNRKTGKVGLLQQLPVDPAQLGSK